MNSLSFQFAFPFSCRRERRNKPSVAPSQNNGQISQSIDSVSGETIDYTYDSLNRLITSATQGPQWGLSFSFDGFGNRLSQTVTKGSGPNNNLSVNAATNRISTSGYSYYPNGNLGIMPYGTGSMTLDYDIENRLIQAVNSNGTERYAYGLDNRRVYQKTASGTEWVFFYGINGDRLRTYQLQGINGFLVTKNNIYFAGRLILGDIGPIHLDRLGSVRNTSRYYPFGEEQGSGTISDKFATYFRDSSTGLDYAMNRYYGSTIGRFTTPDPYPGSAKLGNPQSWNRYAYVNNDPVNKNDPSGFIAVYQDGGFLGNVGDFGINGCAMWDGFLNPGLCIGSTMLLNINRAKMCIDELELPNDREKASLLAVIMGEDSWRWKDTKQYQNGDVIGAPSGKVIPKSDISYEEKLMLQVISNRAYKNNTSIVDEITNRRYLGVYDGFGNILQASFSSPSSSACEHLKMALDNVNNFSRFDITQIANWKSVYPRGATVPRHQNEGDIRVAGTDFY